MVNRRYLFFTALFIMIIIPLVVYGEVPGEQEDLAKEVISSLVRGKVVNITEEVEEEKSIEDLVKAGMNVGRDIMGTMSNTLILAYAGGAIHLILLFMIYDIPVVEIINQDLIASEIVRALAGSIGLVFTVPFTALAASLIYKKGKMKH